MIHTKYFTLTFLFVFTVFNGCESFQDDADDSVLATVGNEELTLLDAMQSIPNVVLQQDTLAALRNYKSDWIEQKIMENEARRIGLETDPEIIRRMERMKSQLLLNALRKAIIDRHRDELEVTTEEAQNYYQANRERFVLDEKYIRFRHLTARTRVDADDARRAIMNGNPWPDVAERYSVNPGQQVRESERFIPISMALPDIPVMSQYVNVIGVTEISPVQAHGGRFHFIQLMEEKPAGSNPDLDWLIDQITEWLYLEKAQRLVNSYKRNLYLQADANNELERLDVGEMGELLKRNRDGSEYVENQ